MEYGTLIEQFLYQSAPVVPVSKEARFEAIVAAVFGSKQRRYGPMPSVEVQYQLRQTIRNMGDEFTFFIPWAARKLRDDGRLDILEFMALKQLLCLRQELARFNVRGRYVFRVENLTDRYLFGETQANFDAMRRYTDDFHSLVKVLFGPSSYIGYESQKVDSGKFVQCAEQYAPVFYRYLKGEGQPAELEEIGWKGIIPQEQQDYYLTAYQGFEWQNKDHVWELAKYFAATLARVKMKATCLPSAEDFVQISFVQPVPGNPVAQNRVYYRSVPEKHTNRHIAPWNGQGYFVIREDNSVCPKVAGPAERLAFYDRETDFGGVKIWTPYILE